MTILIIYTTRSCVFLFVDRVARRGLDRWLRYVTWMMCSQLLFTAVQTNLDKKK